MNDPLKITITTKVVAENGIETTFSLTGTTEQLQYITGWRHQLIAKFEHSPRAAASFSSASDKRGAPAPMPQNNGSGKSADYKRAPLCKCNEEADLIDGIAKSGKNAGKPYARYVCQKPREFACGFSQFLTDEQLTTFLADKERNSSLDSARDIEAENAEIERKYQTGGEDIPF